MGESPSRPELKIGNVEKDSLFRESWVYFRERQSACLSTKGEFSHESRT